MDPNCSGRDRRGAPPVPAPGGRRPDVETVVPDDLRDSLGFRVEREKRHRTVAIGQEVDLAGNPHRVPVTRVLTRNLLDGRIGEPRNPDLVGLAAAVALPGRLPLRQRFVGEKRPVRRQRSALRHRQRKHLGKSPLRSHAEDARHVRVTGSLRREQHAFPVVRPAHSGVRPPMPRQPPRHAARGLDDEDVDVAVVLTGKGHLRSVGGEYRILFDAHACRQPVGRAPRARHAPQVSGVREDDVCRVHRGTAEERRR